jgi:hypothetical protein
MAESWAQDEPAQGSDPVADKTAIIAARLKQIYTKSVLPCEKRFQYDYFYESPFMSDVEFDGTYIRLLFSNITGLNNKMDRLLTFSI